MLGKEDARPGQDMGRERQEYESFFSVTKAHSRVDLDDILERAYEMEPENADFGVVGSELSFQRLPRNGLGSIDPTGADASVGQPHIHIHLERRAEGADDLKVDGNRMREELVAEIF